MGSLSEPKAALFVRVTGLRFEMYRERIDCRTGRQPTFDGKERHMQMALTESLLLRWGKTEPEELVKPAKTSEHIPLEHAYLCQDCESVGNNAKKCPACASAVLMCLASVLNREHVYAANLW